MAPARWHLAFAGVLLAACASTPASRVSDTVRTPAAAAPVSQRLTADEATALTHLASLSGPLDPTVNVHDHSLVTLVSTLTPEDQATFDTQIRAAVDAAKQFPTIE